MRKQLIPTFDAVKNSALASSALSAVISGAGSFVFVLCKEQTISDKVALSMSEAYLDIGISFDILISKINDQDVKIL